MKPLMLQLQAFGPFAARQVVDFRQLGAKTFFLIHGPTGSGKTSILDGICFALFGDSSGGERDGGQMRSHHADPATITEASFEFALGATHYRVKRVPEQQRKALRGAALVRQAQQAELARLDDDGSEEPLASGWGKVTQKVVELLGFESSQFRQVIMLPQGRFFEFLKASSQEREKILQVLFGTELYKRMEEALKRAADEVSARAKEVRTRRQALLDQAQAEDDGALKARQAQQQAALQACQQAEAVAAAAAGAAEARLTAARQAAALFDEFDAAGTSLAVLQSEQPHWQQRRAALQGARQAAVLRPYEAALRQAWDALKADQARQEQRGQALAAARVAQAQAAAALAQQRSRTPELDRLVARVSELDALRPRVAALEQCRTDATTARNAHDAGTRRAAAARAAAGGAAAALEQLQREIQTLTGPAALLEGAKLALQQLRERQRQATELARLRQELALAQQAVQQRQAAVVAADAGLAQSVEARRGTWQQWVAGQAARIAHTLADGAPCPVCGAHEHPAPAAAAAAADDDALALADRRQEQAEAVQRGAVAALAAAQQQLAGVRGKVEVLSGLDDGGADLPARLQQAQEALAQAEAAARELAQRQSRAAEVQARTRDAEAAVQAADAQLQQANSVLQHALGQLEQLQRAIPPELAKAAALDRARAEAVHQRDQLQVALRQAEAGADQAAQALARATALAEESTAACRRSDEVAQRLAEDFQARRRAAGFADADAYRLARMEPQAVATLEADITACEQALAAAVERRRRAERQVAELTRPDVATLESAHAQAKAAWLGGSNAVRDALAALAATSGFVASLDQIAQDFGRLEERHRVLRSVADVATGNNTHRMSFQRYVLATLLEEVLAATTARLRIMSRGRYEMRRKLEAGDARAAGGLDLEVFDQYTGTTRGVGTLSGGESFLASLALALGLSDVVQSYAGGIRLDAIFVDEGFGTLDPEALDFAIRTLKDLQQAGRMVGIISHVSELKEWIDARLELKPTQAGSHAAFVL